MHPLYEKFDLHADQYIEVVYGLAKAGSEIDERIQIVPLSKAEGGSDKYEESDLTVRINLPPVTFYTKTYGRLFADLKFVPEKSLAVLLYGKGKDENGNRHPHAGGSGMFCWSAGRLVTDAIRNMNYHLALITLINVTQTYQPREAYRKPSGTIMCNREGCRRSGRKLDPRIHSYSLGANPYYTEYVCSRHANSCYVSGCENEVEHDIGNGDWACRDHKYTKCTKCNTRTLIGKSIFNRTIDFDKGIQFEILGCEKCLSQCENCNRRYEPETMHPIIRSGSFSLRSEQTYICHYCYSGLVHSNLKRRVLNIPAMEILQWRNEVNKVERNLPLTRT